jgi:hypothetical protein
VVKEVDMAIVIDVISMQLLPWISRYGNADLALQGAMPDHH